MAKSTGNIARVGELLEAGVSPRALRLRADLGPLPGGAQLTPTIAGRRRGARSSGSMRPSPRSTRTARTGPDDADAARRVLDAARDARSMRRSTTT